MVDFINIYVKYERFLHFIIGVVERMKRFELFDTDVYTSID